MINPKKKQGTIDATDHYNDLDPYYRKFWGENLHHGYFKTGYETVEEATQNLVKLIAEAGKIGDGTKVCDVGCGYGAPARLLAKNYFAQVTAITNSKVQWQYARSHDPEQTNPRYILADFLHNSQPSGHFDVVISLESSEYFDDKEKFFHEVYRILKPGGRFVCAAPFAKNHPKAWEVKHLLEPICTDGRLPSLACPAEYIKMMSRAGLEDIHFEDISDRVKRTWTICSRRVLRGLLTDPELRTYLLDEESRNRVFLKTLFRIRMAYLTHSMIYGLFTAVRS